MKCNNCGKDVYGSSIKCPHCYSNLAVYNNGKIMTNKHSTFFNFGGMLFLIFVFPFLFIFLGVVLFGINILGKVTISNIILDLVFSLAIITLILNGFLTLKNNIETEQVNLENKFYKPRKKGIALGWTLISIILLFYPFLFKFVLKEITNLEGIDYSKVDLIEIEDIQIPSLPSVVGEKKVNLNYWFNDITFFNYGFIYDGISIYYSNVSEDEVSSYKLFLIDNGYVERGVKNEQDEIVMVYLKNHSNGKFSIVYIIENLFSYSVVEGMYEDYFD